MSDKATLLALAQRCEAATGPDREIDGRIWCALNGHRFVRFIRHDERIAWGEVDGSLSRSIMCAGMVFEHGSGGDRRNSRFQQFTTSPSYTASIDAAMMLAPKGHTVQLSDWDHETLRAKGAWQAIILPLGARGAMQSYTFSNRCDHAATPALALCCAALRARAELCS